MKLHLTLKKKWFDMILKGEKREEYREIKMYWAERLMTGFPQTYGVIERLNPDFKDFMEIEFRNGYAKDAPIMTVECRGIKFGYTKPEWCDDGEKEVFVIELGRIIFFKNCG